MNSQDDENRQTDQEASIAQLAEARDSGLVREYFGFLAHTRKWWLLPIVALLALAAGLVILAGTGAAPFIYALF
jgi:hypothetical protein